MTLASSRLTSGFNIVERRAILGMDLRPTTPNAMDDEFDDDSFDTGKWTWLDQGSATAEESNDQLRLTLPSDSNRMRGIYQTAPSAPWVFRAKMYLPAGQLGNRLFGFMFAGQSTTQEIRSVGVYQSAVRGISYATPSSGASAWGDLLTITSTVERRGPVWLQMAFDGTSLVAGFSFSGGFTELATVAPGYTPGLIGLGIENDGSPTATFPFGWFRRII